MKKAIRVLAAAAVLSGLSTFAFAEEELR